MTLKTAKRHALLKEHGFELPVSLGKRLKESDMRKIYVAGHRGMVGGAILRRLQDRQVVGRSRLS